MNKKKNTSESEENGYSIFNNANNIIPLSEQRSTSLGHSSDTSDSSVPSVEMSSPSKTIRSTRFKYLSTCTLSGRQIDMYKGNLPPTVRKLLEKKQSNLAKHHESGHCGTDACGDETAQKRTAEKKQNGRSSIQAVNTCNENKTLTASSIVHNNISTASVTTSRGSEIFAVSSRLHASKDTTSLVPSLSKNVIPSTTSTPGASFELSAPTPMCSKSSVSKSTPCASISSKNIITTAISSNISASKSTHSDTKDVPCNAVPMSSTPKLSNYSCNERVSFLVEMCNSSRKRGNGDLAGNNTSSDLAGNNTSSDLSQKTSSELFQELILMNKRDSGAPLNKDLKKRPVNVDTLSSDSQDGSDYSLATENIQGSSGNGPRTSTASSRYDKELKLVKKDLIRPDLSLSSSHSYAQSDSNFPSPENSDATTKHKMNSKQGSSGVCDFIVPSIPSGKLLKELIPVKKNLKRILSPSVKAKDDSSSSNSFSNLNSALSAGSDSITTRKTGCERPCSRTLDAAVLSKHSIPSNGRAAMLKGSVFFH